MKKNLNNMVETLFSPDNRSNIFYIFALVPSVLMLISYLYAENPFVLAIPLYGFIILVIKKHKLFPRPEGSAIQKVFGLVVVVASFFAYYLVSPFFPTAFFYGFANYSLYIVGLFLIFFKVNVLKETLSPLFLVGTSFLSSFFSNFAKSYFTPYIPHLTSFVASVLRAIGMTATQSSFDPNVIMLSASNGSYALMITWGCVGFTSMFLFSVILILIILEDRSSSKSQVMIWSILGLLGTFFVNVIRITAIFVGYYFLGPDYDKIHYYLGYVLFIMWTIFFFYLFSKRDTISQKIRMLYARAKHPNTTANKSVRFDAKNFVKR